MAFRHRSFGSPFTRSSIQYTSTRLTRVMKPLVPAPRPLKKSTASGD